MVISLFLLTLGLYAQGDPRSLRLMGTALEGPVDSVRQQLVASGFKEWGQSDDGEDLYFRGNFYGIRAKLILSQSTEKESSRHFGICYCRTLQYGGHAYQESAVFPL